MRSIGSRAASRVAVTPRLLRRRSLLGGFAAAALLAACGNVAGTATPTSAPIASGAPSAPPATATQAAQVAAVPSPAAAASAASTTLVASSAPVAVASAASPTLRPAGTPGTPTSALRLNTLPPEQLGAPAIPAAAVSTAANAQPYAQAIAPYAKFGTDAPPGTFPRTIRHFHGETIIPAAPQRIVVLGNGELDSLIELGLSPVGIHRTDLAIRPASVQQGAQAAKVVGTQQEPDIEAILALKPDLIIANGRNAEKFYAQVSAVAPTVSGDGGGLVWKHNLALYAQSLGREREAADVFARYEARVRQMNAALPLPRPSVSMIRVSANEVRYMWRTNFIGLVLTELGFPRPANQNIDDFALTGQSLESLGQYAPADLIAVAIDGGENTAHGKDFLASPLWQSLAAVKAGRFMLVPQGTWITGLSLTSALEVMGDFARYFKLPV